VLVEKGIDLRLKTGLQAATGDEVILTDGSRIATKTLVSTVPASPNPIIDALDLPKERGRIKVDAQLQVEGSDHLWAIGDCAVIPDPAGPAPDGKPRFCPPTAQYAVREGELVAENIVAAIRGGSKKPFTFRGLGKMGGLGHHSAVAEVMGMSLSGLPAWLLWRAVYLMKLPGWDRQLKTGLSWMGNMFFPPELVQLKIEHGQGVMQEHYEPGQAVFHQNELGDRLYIILKGRCEVVRAVDGTEQKLAELGPGEYFGEMALLNETTRAATVRVLEAMDVLSVPRPDFNALVTHLPALKQSFEAVAEERQR
jgi:NADH dehydrogenase